MKEYRGVVLALGVVLGFSTTGFAEEFQLKDPLYKDVSEQYVDSTGAHKHNVRLFVGWGSSDYSLINNHASTVSAKTAISRGGGQTYGFEYGYEYGDTPKFLRFSYRKLAVTHRTIRNLTPSSLDVSREQYGLSHAFNIMDGVKDSVELSLGAEVFDRGVDRTRPVFVTKLIEIGPKVQLTYKRKILGIDSEVFGNLMIPVYFDEGIAKTGFNPFAHNLELGLRGFYKVSDRLDIGLGFSGRKECIRFQGQGERTGITNGKDNSYQVYVPLELRTRF